MSKIIRAEILKSTEKAHFIRANKEVEFWIPKQWVMPDKTLNTVGVGAFKMAKLEKEGKIRKKQPYIQLRVAIKKELEKSVLIEDVKGHEHWLPKSQVLEHYDLGYDDMHMILVKEWILKTNKIEYSSIDKVWS